ncbi:chloride channel protein [Fluviispira multicolorata]|uniref:Chloride channel protein n=1 Tax=Fluviispira multicolorata TaxID=2654512 RepID=A0A833N7C7_9BACT|nr:chloride channel protein [Fluviispira multicolorata]KAB8032035.1 chloride channel protein [Fluviispira multicolorata]
MTYFEKMRFLKGKSFAPKPAIFQKRDFFLCILSLFIGIFIGLLSEALKLVINIVTNLFYFGKFSLSDISPAHHQLGNWAFFIPIIGGLIIGCMARFINPAIYGHGIPETMEKVLLNDSIISKRMLILKPAAAAISIGTGGPFGDEGPIIATGGILGSAFGQIIKTSAYERKILLSAGVAGAVSAAFGSPLGGIFLAIELMLFEFKIRSLIPASVSVIAAEFIRMKFIGDELVFPMSIVTLPSASVEIFCFLIIGLIAGIVAVGITHCVHFLENGYAKLPVHWMWWPALGGVGVGAVGLLEPRVLGAGYLTISQILNGHLLGYSIVSIFILKVITWLIAVSSRTTAGTLAPLFMVGSALGVTLYGIIVNLFPLITLDVKVAALVGMAALFCGVTRAFLASVFITLESTHQFWAAVPVLTGCIAAYIVSLFLMQHSILTQELGKKGVKFPHDENIKASDNENQQKPNDVY